MAWFKVLITCVFAALIASCAATGDPDVSGKRVIVVGAGIAGLNAAQLMQKQGFEVTVLESRNRIGGRLWSDHSLGNATVDLGASWIHGIRFNPIHSLAQQHNIPLIEWDYDNSSFYDTEGNENPALAAKIETLVNTLGSSALSGNSSSSTIDEVVEQARVDERLEDYTESQVNYVISSYIESEYAGPSDKLSAHALEEGSAFGGAEVIFPQGYDQLATVLATNINIELGHRVTEINYESENPTVIANDKVFSADHVLVTVPLGVLKKDIIRFTPSLPTNKTNAIRALDMGTLNKVYLKFSNAFWENEATNIEYISDTKGKYVTWLNLTQATGEPILMAFTSGNFGKSMENFSDEEIIADAMTVLRTIYGDNIPDPDSSIITRWANDPHSYGSYSYLTVEADNQMRETLAEAVQAKVFFAGEATHEDYPATVHGAYLSGKREAEKILDVYR